MTFKFVEIRGQIVKQEVSTNFRELREWKKGANDLQIRGNSWKLADKS